MSNDLTITVAELLEIFAGGMRALVPWLEKARINWKDGESYDDWDVIAESLYSTVVCASLIGEVVPTYPIAKYDFYYREYASIDFIEVKERRNPNRRFAFIAYGSRLTPLDFVKVAELDDNDNVVSYVSLELDDLDFYYVRHVEGKRVAVEAVTVAL